MPFDMSTLTDDDYERFEEAYNNVEGGGDWEDLYESDKYYELIERSWKERKCSVRGLPAPRNEEDMLNREPCITQVPFGYYMEYMRVNNPMEYAIQWDALDEEARMEEKEE